MIETLNDFIREYQKICQMGWIKTHRSGPTGIGKTLEDLLGIVENNIDGPDFGDYELKSCRLNSNSMLTIFTKTPQPQAAAAFSTKITALRGDVKGGGVSLRLSHVALQLM